MQTLQHLEKRSADIDEDGDPSVLDQLTRCGPDVGLSCLLKVVG